MSVSQAVRERIAAQLAGEPFTPALFAGVGSRAAIDQALMRFAKDRGEVASSGVRGLA